MSIQLIFTTLWQNRSLVFRGLLCWGIACLILNSDEVNSYDTRLQIRGEQPVSSEIVLISFRANDLQENLRMKLNKENRGLTDAAYWNEGTWYILLQKLLEQTPKSIGVTLLLPDQLFPDPHEETLKLFLNKKIIWGIGPSDGEHNPLFPFSKYVSLQVGEMNFLHDEDGVVRRFQSPSKDFSSLVELVSGQTLTAGWTPHFINFRGTARVFPKFYVSDILRGKIPSDAFKNKILLIGAENLEGGKYLTPVGILNRSEVLAHVTDNLLAHRWIHRFHFWIYTVLLLFIMLAAVFIILKYPPSIAFAMLIWLCLLLVSASVWIFDSYYYWLPLTSSVLLIAVLWIVFIGYQAHRMEQRSWKLEQEKNFTNEVEQLKNNFVSLISHDLKTPIAKIQSISDRLLLQNLSEDILNDLQSLRSSSEELHRYIQSILKLLRLESRDLKLHREVCDINHLIDQAVAQLRPLAKEKNIEIVNTQDPLFSMEADVTLIREVLINILENAIKYTPTGGLVRVHSAEIENNIQVQIEDNGPGIPETEIELVWNKFVRGKDQDLKTKGTGLGLYLVKFFIELHGGTVSIESKFGTKVTFTLPLEAPESTEDSHHSAAFLINDHKEVL